jgi:hypothetical protein
MQNMDAVFGPLASFVQKATRLNLGEAARGGVVGSLAGMFTPESLLHLEKRDESGESCMWRLRR